MLLKPFQGRRKTFLQERQESTVWRSIPHGTQNKLPSTPWHFSVHLQAASIHEHMLATSNAISSDRQRPDRFNKALARILTGYDTQIVQICVTWNVCWKETCAVSHAWCVFTSQCYIFFEKEIKNHLDSCMCCLKITFIRDELKWFFCALSACILKNSEQGMHLNGQGFWNNTWQPSSIM